MLAFAQIPSIICLVPAGFLELYLAGRVRHPDISAFLSNELPDILGVIGSGWTITLEVIGIMELRRLPAGKATLNVFLPFLLILIPAGIIYVLLLF